MLTIFAENLLSALTATRSDAPTAAGVAGALAVCATSSACFDAAGRNAQAPTREACREVARADRDHRPVCSRRRAPAQADIAGDDQRHRNDDRFVHRLNSLAALGSRARAP
jgi:hypothetical protein